MLLPCRSTSQKDVTNLHSKMLHDAARIGLHDRHRLVRCAKRNELRGCAARSCHRGSQRAIKETDVYGRSGGSRQRLLVAAGEVRHRRLSPPSAAVAARSTNGGTRRGVDRCLHARSARKVCTQGLHGGPNSPTSPQPVVVVALGSVPGPAHIAGDMGYPDAIRGRRGSTPGKPTAGSVNRRNRDADHRERRRARRRAHLQAHRGVSRGCRPAGPNQRQVSRETATSVRVTASTQTKTPIPSTSPSTTRIDPSIG
jgi:hypothetical protein